MSILLTLILIVALIVAGLVFFTANTARKVEARVPPCGQFVGIDRQRLHYIDTGGAGCQSASKIDPRSAFKIDPLFGRSAQR